MLHSLSFKIDNSYNQLTHLLTTIIFSAFPKHLPHRRPLFWFQQKEYY